MRRLELDKITAEKLKALGFEEVNNDYFLLNLTSADNDHADFFVTKINDILYIDIDKIESDLEIKYLYKLIKEFDSIHKYEEFLAAIENDKVYIKAEDKSVSFISKKQYDYMGIYQDNSLVELGMYSELEKKIMNGRTDRIINSGLIARFNVSDVILFKLDYRVVELLIDIRSHLKYKG